MRTGLLARPVTRLVGIAALGLAVALGGVSMTHADETEDPGTAKWEVEDPAAEADTPDADDPGSDADAPTDPDDPDTAKWEGEAPLGGVTPLTAKWE